MSKDKKTTSNYTESEVSIMEGIYDPEESSYEVRSGQVDDIVEKLGKTRGSVIQKLVRMGIYQKKENVSGVTGGKPETKENLVSRLESLCNLKAGELETLGKANKLAIMAVYKAISSLREDSEGTTDTENQVTQ